MAKAELATPLVQRANWAEFVLYIGKLEPLTGTLPTSQLTGALAAAQFPALSGDVTTVAGALGTTLATVNANLGNFGDSTHHVTLTVDAKGRIIAISAVTPSIATSQLTGVLAAAQFPALTGDITTVAGALATTLATVNSNVGSFGDATHHLSITVNAKGLITAISTVATNYVLGTSALATASLVPYITAAGTLGQDGAFVWDATHHWHGIGMTPDSVLSC